MKKTQSTLLENKWVQNSAEADVLREVFSQYFMFLSHGGLNKQQSFCPVWRNTLLREDSILLKFVPDEFHPMAMALK